MSELMKAIDYGIGIMCDHMIAEVGCVKCQNRTAAADDLRGIRAEVAALKESLRVLRLDLEESRHARDAGYAQGVEATEAKAVKRITDLEAEVQRLLKLSSDAGSKGHALLAKLGKAKAALEKARSEAAYSSDSVNALSRIECIAADVLKDIS